MEVMKEQEDKFDVEADWVLPPVADLVPDGGSLSSAGPVRGSVTGEEIAKHALRPLVPQASRAIPPSL